MNRRSENTVLPAAGGYPDITAIEREARRLRAQHLAALVKRARNGVREWLSGRSPVDLRRGAHSGIG